MNKNKEIKKEVVVACGKGLATSSMVILKVNDILMENNIKANVTKCSLKELSKYDGKADLIITTMKVDKDKYVSPVVIGNALLVGFNEEPIVKEIVEVLSKKEETI